MTELFLAIEAARDAMRRGDVFACDEHLRAALSVTNRLRRRDYTGRVMRVRNRLRPVVAAAGTPGPWTITRSKMATDGAFDYAISAGAVSVLAEAFGRDAHGGWPPAEANARLIAAAPDLLEAVMVALDTSEYESDRQIFRAAIAKATGAP